jgi:hypothetical protein
MNRKTAQKHIFMKLNGASDEDLERFRVKTIEIYTDIGK